MRLILLGAPAPGRAPGPSSSPKYGMPQISTGDMLRAAVKAQTELGRQAKTVMDAGGLVSDDIIIGLVKERIKEPDCARVSCLTAFPAPYQAEAMVEAGVDLDRVVEIAVPDDAIVARLSGRRVHPGSGRVYHIEHNPPKRDGLDDETGEPLVLRDDDHEDTVRKRLPDLSSQTSPLVEFYLAMSGPRAPACHRVEV